MSRLDHWRSLISLAPNEDELVSLVRGYCDQWEPRVVAALPAGCQACWPSTANEISELAVAFTVAELRFQGGEEMLGVLREMSALFIAAGERLRRLRAAHEPTPKA